MSSFLLRHYRALYLLLPVLLGLALGHLAATILGIYLTPPILPASEKTQTRPAVVRPTAIADFQGILDRNIFNSAAPQAGDLSAVASSGESAAPAVRTDLALFGTITRGAGSLAIIKAGEKVKTFHLGDEIPGGGTIEAIERHSVLIRAANGAEQVLQLYEQAGGGSSAPNGAPATSAPATGATSGGGEIRSVGENRWAIPQSVAEQARGNIGELLKQARLEPNLVNGKTEGFVVRMIQPRSVLANLGLQRGDVLMQINNVELDSPEKALQVFQQLREAKNLSIALLRNGNKQTFEYEVN